MAIEVVVVSLLVAMYAGVVKSDMSMNTACLTVHWVVLKPGACYRLKIKVGIDRCGIVRFGGDRRRTGRSKNH